jgi:hypothetical protein
VQRVLTALTACVLSLTACTSATTPSSTSPSGAASPSADAAPVAFTGTTVDAGQANAFAALEPATQRSRGREIVGKIEKQIAQLTGLPDAVGGTAPFEAAYNKVSGTLAVNASKPVNLGKLTQSQVAPKRAAERPLAGGTTEYSGADIAKVGGVMVLGGWYLPGTLADSIVSETNDVPAGKTEKGQHDSTSGTVTGSGTIDSATIESTNTYTEGGITGSLQVKITVNPCPDASGKFTAKATINTSVTKAGGSIGTNDSIDIDLTGYVSDDAELTSYDAETRAQASDFASGKGSFIDVTMKSTVIGGEVESYSADVNRSGGGATPDLAKGWAIAGMLTQLLVTNKVLDAAAKGWKSGRCVALNPTTSPSRRTGLKPSTSVKITAPPRSKVDGQPVGGTVTATLTGPASVQPAGSKVPADATFTYIAPGEENKTGGVALEARSKRGVAKAQVDFDTNVKYSYHIKGGLQDFQPSQDICDVLKPFNLSSGGISMNFTGGLSGTYSYSGVFNAAGKGYYRIDLPNGPGKPGTMIGGGPGVIGGQSGSGTEKYVLTPITCQ